MIPDVPTCYRILEEDGVPPHIVEHSATVARVALQLADELMRAGESLDTSLIEAAALLHDIKKMFTIEHGGNHARLGGERVSELGFVELEDAVARHVDLGRWDDTGPVTETEVVFYSDKRVKHTELVTLSERFIDLLERYGTTEGARSRIRQHQQTVVEVERKIFSRIPGEPDEMSIGE